uniref:PPM-type phosphatase domain-containing protein n=1 Tax=Kalanchoe fedtschenkoi TaxID=63787 RepID=A0A7N0T276_KALFE
MFLNGKGLKKAERAAGDEIDKVCADTSVLLMKLVVARHSMDNVSVIVVDLKKRRWRRVLGFLESLCFVFLLC